MDVTAVNPYVNAYINPRENEQQVQKFVRRTIKPEETVKPKTASEGDNGSEPLLTKREREFFIQMFPERTEQIEKHVLFTRNGQLKTHNVNKGMIFDGRA